jgi:hypothetical protein
LEEKHVINKVPHYILSFTSALLGTTVFCYGLFMARDGTLPHKTRDKTITLNEI